MIPQRCRLCKLDGLGLNILQSLSPSRRRTCQEMTSSSKGRRSSRRKEVLARGLGNAMRKGEFEVLGKELLDVWSPNICGFLNFDDLENLRTALLAESFSRGGLRSPTWIDLNRALCLAAMSW